MARSTGLAFFKGDVVQLFVEFSVKVLIVFVLRLHQILLVDTFISFKPQLLSNLIVLECLLSDFFHVDVAQVVWVFDYLSVVDLKVVAVVGDLEVGLI